MHKPPKEFAERHARLGRRQSNPNADNANLHTYNAPATYTVTATDALGLQTTVSQGVTPNGLPLCTLSVIQGCSTQLINGVPNTVVSATPTCTSPQSHTFGLNISG